MAANLRIIRNAAEPIAFRGLSSNTALSGADLCKLIANLDPAKMCPKHPAFEPNNCPACGASAQIGR